MTTLTTVDTLTPLYSQLLVCETELRALYHQYREPHMAELHTSLCASLRDVEARINDMISGPHRYELVRSLRESIYGEV